MLGAIVGDIVGSPYEFSLSPPPVDGFDLFDHDANWTDDTLMTLAVCQAVLAANGDTAKAPQMISEAMRSFARLYRLARGGYGGQFVKWLGAKNPEPYNSFGNGSAMRVSSVGWLFPTLEETEQWASITAAVTHNHPEGIKGAQATAAAIFLARIGRTKKEIAAYIEQRFRYDLSPTKNDEPAPYIFGTSMTCQVTMPEALKCFLQADDFEQCLRLAVAMGGDTDTRAAIAGSIAEPFFGIPADLRNEAEKRLVEPRHREIVAEFLHRVNES